MLFRLDRFTNETVCVLALKCELLNEFVDGLTYPSKEMNGFAKGQATKSSVYYGYTMKSTEVIEA